MKSLILMLLTDMVVLAQADGKPAGVWFEHRARPSISAESSLSDEEIERITSLGYFDGYVRPSANMNVTIYDRHRTFPGTNLIVSGHAPEALLMDADGQIMHTWRKDILDVWPELANEDVEPVSSFWRCHLFDNGDLLALYNGFGIVKLDHGGNLIWKSSTSDRPPWQSGAHHDWWITRESIYALSRNTDVVRPELRNGDKPIDEDFVAVLDHDGVLRDRFSLFEAFAHSEFASLLKAVHGKSGHVLHANSIEVLSRDLPSIGNSFRKGNLLISCRDIDTVAVIGMESRRVVWAAKGQWLAQHSARFLENGNILLFDNQGNRPTFHEEVFAGGTRILEFNPSSQEVAWSYSGSDLHPFSCYKMGTVHRLPNENTLVADSLSGRAFEVTPGGDIVWEWISPFRAGEQQQWIAAMGDIVRIPADFPMDWVKSAANEAHDIAN